MSVRGHPDGPPATPLAAAGGPSDPEALTWSYSLSLERQIAGGGSSLACGDEELRKKVEDMLGGGDAQQTHRLGLDPLQVMEESLRAQGRCGLPPQRPGLARPLGLQALAKAFQVLEQAALNLHLSPWREEYRVVQMHSGTFTHVVRPVFSTLQAQQLFGLLGYRSCSVPHQQLRLQTHGSAPSADVLLRLACAFFLARCECGLLLAALGKHGGEVEWELRMVEERRRGHSLQVSLDHTRRQLDVPLTGQRAEASELSGDVGPYLDLYTDQQLNGAHDRDRDRDWDVNPPRSLHWPCASSAVPAVAPVSPSSSASHQPKYQLGKVSPSVPDAAESLSWRPTSDSPPLDSCLSVLNLEAMGRCVDERLSACGYTQLGGRQEAEQVTGHAQHHQQDPHTHWPITFHECCDQARPNPHAVCITCRAFHSASCTAADECRELHHLQSLDGCSSCGRPCSRKPLVLCRYCGSEYCSECWYRRPMFCACGQTFDQSSSV